MPAGEVVVSTVVTAPADKAFADFTDGIDRWWKRPPGTLVRFDGDRLVAVSHAGADVLAVVDAWEPPRRIDLQWHGPHAAPGDTVTVEFVPEGAGTRVIVTHRRPLLRPQDAVAAVLGLWWGDLLRRLSRPTSAAT
jgi:uncharacterized protein YndB with AHSA1/START domain